MRGAPELRGNIRTKDKRLNIGGQLDLTRSPVSYKDIYKKNAGEKLKLQTGLFYSPGNIDISWYLLEFADFSLSRTGSISTDGVTVLNIIGEDIKLRKLRDNFSFIKKYIAGGNMNIRSTFKESSGRPEAEVNLDIKNLGIINFKGLTNLYEKLSNKRETRFDINNTSVKLKLTKERLRIENLELTGGDIEGTGKGYYIWDKELNFTLYPRIEGRKLGLRVYGSTDNVKVSLK